MVSVELKNGRPSPGDPPVTRIPPCGDVCDGAATAWWRLKRSIMKGTILLVGLGRIDTNESFKHSYILFGEGSKKNTTIRIFLNWGGGCFKFTEVCII